MDLYPNNIWDPRYIYYFWGGFSETTAEVRESGLRQPKSAKGPLAMFKARAVALVPKRATSERKKGISQATRLPMELFYPKTTSDPGKGLFRQSLEGGGVRSWGEKFSEPTPSDSPLESLGGGGGFRKPIPGGGGRNLLEKRPQRDTRHRRLVRSASERLGGEHQLAHGAKLHALSGGWTGGGAVFRWVSL